MAKQDPWADVPVVRSRSDEPQAAPNLPVGTIPEGRGGRNDTALLNQGYRPTEDGAWRREYTPEEMIARGYEFDAANQQWTPTGQAQSRDPWANVEVAQPTTQSQALAEQAAAARREELNRDGQAVLSGVMLGFNDEIAGRVAQGGQMASNAVRTATGRPIEIESRDLRDAVTTGIRREAAEFARERPVSNIALQVAGGGLTGGAGAGRSGIVNGFRVGAGYGAVTGAGLSEGGFVERLPGAAGGAVAGGALGGGLAAAAPYAQRLAGIAGNRVSSLNPFASRGAPAGEVAARRLAGTIDESAALAERARLQSLGLNPSIADVSGGTTERLVRTAAGPAGPGAEVAVANSVARRTNLNPEAMTVTQALSPETRTATELAEGLTTQRGAQADTMYPEAYATPVRVTDDVLRALSDDPGRAALRRARAAAVARQNADQVTEIDSLLNGTATEVSAGTLDRVRIAMAGRGARMNQSPDTRDIASGLFSRAGQIDEVLEGVPQMAPARQAYRDTTGAIEAVEAPLNVFNTEPRQFAQWVRGLTPEQREAATVGIRQTILDALGGQRASGTGTLDRLSQAPYARDNLRALLGDEAAEQYIASIQARVQQSQRAARISPNTNSQTFGREIDEAGFNPVETLSAALDGAQSLGNPMAAARTAGRLQNLGARMTMTPEVRESIVRLGLGSADDLENVLAAAQAARQANRPPPRQVRAYVTRVTNVLGRQSPITQQIEQLLLPAPSVLAEEDQP